jgi:hypothetical protein
MRLAPLALLAVLLAGCEESPRRDAGAEGAAAMPRARAAVQAAEDRLRARLRIEGPMTLRAVAAHRQAIADTVAVCGQINPSGRGDEPFIPWVAVVAFEGDRPARTELVLGASSAEASRVYLELVDRCWDGGGPAHARAVARPLPPMPSELPRQVPPAEVAAPAAAPAVPAPIAPPPSPPSAVAATGTVTTTSRHPVNIRAHPSGGGAVLRIVPRGATLQVFGEAPGGWLQVGEGGEPWGWLHSSLLDGR